MGDFFATSLTVYDGLIAGGGDGTLNHVLYALTLKTLRESGKESEANQENPSLVKPNITVGTLPVLIYMGWLKKSFP